jgi:hypothetical protein
MDVAAHQQGGGVPRLRPFEVAEGQWHPVSIQQDYVGSYREAVFIGEDGKVFVRPAEVRDIASFAHIWDRNMKAQGFVDAAKNRASAV